jgi:hypothetical protein
MRKRILALLLSLLMAFTVMPMQPVFASGGAQDEPAGSGKGLEAPITALDTGSCGDDLAWSYDEGVLTLSGTGAMYDYDGDSNRAPWYELYAEEIRSVVIGSGVTALGEYAFAGLTALESLDMDALQIPEIPDYLCFGCTGLYEVRLPASATVIGEGAFSGCTKLDTAEIRYGTVTIEDYAFADTAIKRLGLPPTMRTIGDYAFQNCTALRCIRCAEGLQTAGVGAFSGCRTLTNAYFPATVTSFGDYCFYYNLSLERLQLEGLPPSVGDNTFLECTPSFAHIYYSAQYADVWTAFGSKWHDIWIQQNSSSEIAWSVDEQTGTLTFSGTTAMSFYSETKLAPWYPYRDIITSVAAEEGVTSIYSMGLFMLDELASISLPASIIQFEINQNPKLENIELAAGNTSFMLSDGVLYSANGVVAYACERDKSGAFVSPSALKQIQDFCFAHTDITSFKLNTNVSAIGDGAFAYCDQLTEFIMEGAGNYYKVIDGVLYNGTSYIKACPGGITGELVLSGTVSYVAAYAFAGAQLNKVTLPMSVYQLNANSFIDCPALTEITVKNPTTYEMSVYNCPSLERMVYLGTAASINTKAFIRVSPNFAVYYTEANQSSWAPNGETERSGYPIVMVPTEKYPCGDDLEYSFDLATQTLTFYGTGDMYDYNDTDDLPPWHSVASQIVNVSSPDGMTRIGAYAFCGYTALTSFNIGAGVTSIGEHAFKNTPSLGSLSVASGNTAFVTSSGSIYDADTKMLLTCLWIDTYGSLLISSCTSIGPRAFADCRNITDYSQLTFPAAVTELAPYAFADLASMPQISIAGVTEIPEGAFENCSALTSVTLSENVTSIGANAFKNCPLLTGPFVFNPGLNAIGDSAFYGCSALESVRMLCEPPASFGTGVFTGCAANFVIEYLIDYASLWAPNGETEWNGWPIVSYTIPNPSGLAGSVSWEYDPATHILSLWAEGTGTYAIPSYSTSSPAPWAQFADECVGVEMSSQVSSIGAYAFYNFTELEFAHLPQCSSTYQINSYAFYGCSKLSELTFPNNINRIYQYAFYGCSKLSEFVCPGELYTIGNYAFAYCTTLTYFKLCGTVRELGNYVFTGCYSLDEVTTDIMPGYSRGFITLNGVLYNDNVNTVYWVPTKKTGTVVIAPNVYLLKPGAIYNTRIETLILPDSVTNLNTDAIRYNQQLTTILFKGNKPTSTGSNCIYNNNSELTVYYLADNAANWTAAGTTWQGLPIAEWQGGTTDDFGKCGDYLVYNYDSASHTLTISPLATGSDMSTYSAGTAPWAAYGDEIETVVVENGAGSIGAYAFYGLTNLTSVTLPTEGLTYIWDYAFAGCASLPSITLPDSIDRILTYAFAECASLTSVYIPASVTRLYLAFFACASLESITVDPASESYSSVDGVLFNKEQTDLILYPLAKTATTYTVPAGVTIIDGYAFAFNPVLEEIILPDGLFTIVEHAFSDATALTHITIPATVGRINYSAFLGCSELREAEFLGNPPTTFGGNVFDDCWEYFRIAYPEELASLWSPHGENVWNGYPIVTIGTPPFDLYACGDDMHWAFDPETGTLTITGTGDMWTFADDLPPRWHNYEDDINAVVIEDGPESISERAFYGYSSLETVTISASVTDIGAYAFANCPQLTAFTVDPASTSYASQDGVLFNKAMTELIQAPTRTTGDYIVPSGVVRIEDGAFRCTAVSSVTMPSSVTEIGAYCFEYCEYLETVNFSENLENVPANAFRECISLTAARLMGGVTYIGISAFEGCVSLETVIIPSTANIISDRAFYGCTALETLTIAEGLQKICEDAFNSCTSLESVMIPPSVVEIGDGAFCTCTSLSTLILQDGLETIGWSTFCECEALTSVTLPESITLLCGGAFSWCPDLDEVIFRGPKPVMYYDSWNFTFGDNSVDLIVMYYEEYQDSWAPNGEETLMGRCPLVMIESELEICEGAGANLTWTFDPDDGRLTISGTGPMYDFKTQNPPWYNIRLSIIDVIIEPGVTSIGYGAFKNCNNLDFCLIPEGVTSIGARAFYWCYKLESLVMPTTIDWIGSRALSYAYKSYDVIFMGDPPAHVASNAFVIPLDDNGNEHTNWFDIVVPESRRAAWDPDGDGMYGRYNLYYFDLEEDGAGPEAWYDYYKLINYPGEAVWIRGRGETFDWTPEEHLHPAYEVHICKTITTIGDYMFCGWSMEDHEGENCEWVARELRDLTIHDYVTSIGDHAFENAYMMRTLDIGESVAYIGEYAFKAAARLETITIDPDNEFFTVVDGILFDKYQTRILRAPATLTGEYTVPSTVTKIDPGAFDYTHLTTINIGPNVTEIGEGAFAYTSLSTEGNKEAVPCLENINVDPANPVFASVGGVLYSKDLKTVICVPVGKTGVIEIPEGMTEIAPSAFKGCEGITGVVFPSTLTSIGAEAFMGCTSLVDVIIPAGVTEIGDNAFAGCSELFTATFEGPVPANYGEGIFDGASRYFRIYYTADYASSWAPNGEDEWIEYPIVLEGSDACGDDLRWTFDEEYYTLIIFGTGDMYDYSAAEPAPWAELPVRTVDVWPGAESIGAYAFAGLSGMYSAYIAETVTELGEGAFMGCSDLENLSIVEGSITSVPAYCFKGCTELGYFPIEYLTYIGTEAFMGCVWFGDPVFSAELAYLGDRAFSGCSGVASATFAGEPPAYFGTDVFSDCDEGFLIRIPAEYLESWPVDSSIEWNGLPVELFGENVIGRYLVWYYDEDTHTLTIWGMGEMFGSPKKGGGDEPDIPWADFAEEIEHIVLPEMLTGIGDNAFRNCVLVTGVTLPDQLESIGAYAFFGSGLTSVVIPDSVVTVGEYAFCFCEDLVSAVIGTGIETIPEGMFGGCEQLESVNIPAGVTEIGEYAFCEDPSLENVVLPNGLERIEAYAFAATGLTTAIVPASVTYIGEHAFDSSEGLVTVIFEGMPPELGDDAFANCSDDLYIEYMHEYASSWAPNGETTWEGWRITEHGTPYYTVSFVDRDGSLIKAQRTAQGGDAVAPEPPEHEGYVFHCWSHSYTGVTRNVTTYALYKVFVSGGFEWAPTDTITPGLPYLIGFVDNGVTYLAVSYAPEASNHYYTSFSGNYCGYTAPAQIENGCVVGVSGWVNDLTYCTWTFSTYTGGYIRSTYNSYYLATYSSSSYGDLYPNSSSSNGSNWTFDASAHTLSRLVSSTRMYAGYYYNNGSYMKAVKNIPESTVQLFVSREVPAPEETDYYVVAFEDWDGSVLWAELVEEGGAATAPADPEREGWSFLGWDTAFDNVTQDITVTAVYQPEGESCTVTFVDWDGTVLSTQQVVIGYGAIAPADPVREGYTFIGWDCDFSSVTGDLTVTAQYAINTYTVTFVDWDGTVLSTQTVEYGSAAAAPADPEREGYTFIGWDCDFSSVIGDLTVTAIYEENVPPVTIVPGDVDCNGLVNMADLALAASYVQNSGTVTDQGILNGDMNGDGAVTAADLAALYQLILG